MVSRVREFLRAWCDKCQRHSTHYRAWGSDPKLEYCLTCQPPRTLTVDGKVRKRRKSRKAA